MPSDSRAEQEAWRKTLTDGHIALGTMRRVMGLLPGTPRCKICNNPFGGFGGHVCRAIGMYPSRKSPHVCAACCEKMPAGGAEIEIAVLFADVRGSTELAEQLGPTAYAEALNRFYQAAMEVLPKHDATIDKLIGDEVMAFFVPGFAGPDQYKAKAVAAARALLLRLGYGAGADAAWIPVGVGIDAGVAFVGNVGSEGYVDFTALGDPVNTAARIQAEAGPGEILIGARIRDALPDTEKAGPGREITVKGKAAPLRVHAVALARS